MNASRQNGGVVNGLPTLIQHTLGSGVPYRGTFLCHLQLFRMTIQQDPYEPDRWWFAPLLYTGAALVIAALVLA
jgi:hypothetical protein